MKLLTCALCLSVQFLQCHFVLAVGNVIFFVPRIASMSHKAVKHSEKAVKIYVFWTWCHVEIYPEDRSGRLLQGAVLYFVVLYCVVLFIHPSWQNLCIYNCSYESSCLLLTYHITRIQHINSFRDLQSLYFFTVSPDIVCHYIFRDKSS